MRNWLATVAATVAAAVLSAVLIPRLTKPSSPVAAVAPVAPYSVTGLWNFAAISEVDHKRARGTLRLTMDGEIVSGELETPDNSKTGVHGTFANDILELTRDTGLETVQNYRLRKLGAARFSGEFWNVGKIPDKGTFEIEK